MRNFSSMRPPEWMAKLVSQRYGPDLHYRYRKPLFYRLLNDYYVVTKNIAKFAVRAITGSKMDLPGGSGIFGIVETQNQLNAITESSYVKSSNILDLRQWQTRNASLAIIHVFLLIFLPFFWLVFRSHRNAQLAICEGYVDYYFCILLLKKIYLNSELVVSNDHCGFVFILQQIALREMCCQDLRLVYVAHAPAKPEFPFNYFHKVMVWSHQQKKIYKKLCKRSDVEINVLLREEPSVLIEDRTTILISHPVRIWTILSLRRKICGRVVLRFHPSDEFKKRCLSPFFRLFSIEIDSSVTAIEAIKRSKICYSAMSSALVNLPTFLRRRVVCVMSLGRDWRYYDNGLEGIRIVDTVADIQAD